MNNFNYSADSLYIGYVLWYMRTYLSVDIVDPFMRIVHKFDSTSFSSLAFNGGFCFPFSSIKLGSFDLERHSASC